MTRTPKPKRRATTRRNPFACAAYGRWIMRSIAADAQSAKAAARRQNAAGATLH